MGDSFDERPQTLISTIKITRVMPDGRTRFREPENIPSLAASLKEFGQLQPIILDEDGELVAGMRRLTAAKSLGWTSIWAVLRNQLDDLTARSIELEENLQREQMSPAEKIKAIAELHRLKKEQDPNWGQSQTAQLAGMERSRVVEAIKLATMMEFFPELAEAKSINQMQSWALSKASSQVRMKEVKDAPEIYKEIEERIILGDSVEVIKSLPKGFIKLILTDPPFGIDYDNRKAGSEGSVTAYKDDAESYERLLSMAPDLYEVLQPDGWLVWFLGPTWYERAKGVFREAGFTVDEIPIIWHREGGRAYTTRPDRYFGRAYDMALHCIKGNPQMVERGKPNVITCAPVEGADRTLLVERPVELYEELIKRLTIKGEMVVDFFTGSGSCLAAAAKTQRQYMGVELDPERRAVAIKKVRAYTPESA